MTRIAPKKAFQILGVSPSDDFATIRRAWIALVKANHPDVVGGDLKELTARLTEINEAYDSLRWHSPEKVRIRQQQQAASDRRAEPDRRETGGRRSGTDRRKAAQDWSGPDRRTTQDRRAEDARRTDPPRREGGDRRQAAGGTPADRRDAAWAALSIAERFRAVQILSAPDAAARNAGTRRVLA